MPRSNYRTRASIPHSTSNYGTFCCTASLGMAGLLFLGLLLGLRCWWRSCRLCLR